MFDLNPRNFHQHFTSKSSAGSPFWIRNVNLTSVPRKSRSSDGIARAIKNNLLIVLLVTLRRYMLFFWRTLARSRFTCRNVYGNDHRPANAVFSGRSKIKTKSIPNKKVGSVCTIRVRKFKEGCRETVEYEKGKQKRRITHRWGTLDDVSVSGKSIVSISRKLFHLPRRLCG